MSTVVAVLCLLACGIAFAEEKAKELTPAQKIAIRRYYDDSIEDAKRFILKVNKDLESNTDPARHERLMRMKSVKERELSGMEREREDTQQYEVFWRSLQRFKATKRLQWQEPKEGEKEGKWVPIQSEKPANSGAEIQREKTIPLANPRVEEPPKSGIETQHSRLSATAAAAATLAMRSGAAVRTGNHATRRPHGPA